MFESILTIAFIIALMGWFYNKVKVGLYERIWEMEDAETDPYVTDEGRSKTVWTEEQLANFLDKNTSNCIDSKCYVSAIHKKHDAPLSPWIISQQCH